MSWQQYMGALITSMMLSECHKNVTADQADPAQKTLQNTLQTEQYPNCVDYMLTFYRS